MFSLFCPFLPYIKPLQTSKKKVHQNVLSFKKKKGNYLEIKKLVKSRGAAKIIIVFEDYMETLRIPY